MSPAVTADNEAQDCGKESGLLLLPPHETSRPDGEPGNGGGDYRGFAHSLEREVSVVVLEQQQEEDQELPRDQQRQEEQKEAQEESMLQQMENEFSRVNLPPNLSSESPLPRYDDVAPFPALEQHKPLPLPTLQTLEDLEAPTASDIRRRPSSEGCGSSSPGRNSLITHARTGNGGQTPSRHRSPAPPPTLHQVEEPKYARVNPKSKRSSTRQESSRNGTPKRMRRGQIEASSGEENDSFLMSTTMVSLDEGNASGQQLLVRRTHSDSIDMRPSHVIEEEEITPLQKGRWRKKANDALQSVVTALYCKILVILGLAFPMAEVISDNVPRGYYQLFYVYLFMGSLLFLFCIYIDLLRTRAMQTGNKTKRDKPKRGSRQIGQEDQIDRTTEVNAVPRPRAHYGSFYLRLGAVLFGIGSMIYSGIEIGMFFELNLDEEADCKNLFSVLRPVLQMTFVFVQMYFIFLNQKMNIYKNKFFSRFGLMHMIATNLCVWLNVLILETSHEISETMHKRITRQSQSEFYVPGATQIGRHLRDTVSHVTNDSSFVDLGSQTTPTVLSDILGRHFELHDLVSLCHRKNNIMSKLLTDSGPFLFPCTIEYSLICAAVLFVMWKNIAEEHEHYKFQKKRRKMSAGTHHNNSPQDSSERSAHHYSVDCTHANTGLFTGIFVMVLTIISLIVFFVLISSQETRLHEAAITVAAMTEVALYCLTTIAVLIGMCQTKTPFSVPDRTCPFEGPPLLVYQQVRVLWYDTSRKLELDNLLLVVAQTGVFIYAAFCIIGAFFQLKNHLVAFLASLATLTQTTLQTIFILDASSRFAYCSEQVKNKPGREVVTFLLVCNLAMWAINTLETNRADSHPIQVQFYGGDWAWPIITHISMPLAIFYRFHSTVCLCEIWKKSFKYKTTNSLSYV